MFLLLLLLFKARFLLAEYVFHIPFCKLSKLLLLNLFCSLYALKGRKILHLGSNKHNQVIPPSSVPFSFTFKKVMSFFFPFH